MNQTDIIEIYLKYMSPHNSDYNAGLAKGMDVGAFIVGDYLYKEAMENADDNIEFEQLLKHHMDLIAPQKDKNY